MFFSDCPAYRDVFDAQGHRIAYIRGKQSDRLGNGLPNLAQSSASALYTHPTYLNERLGQWRQLEPPISLKDRGAIMYAYWGSSQRPAIENLTTTKAEIRRLLVALDKQRVARGKKPRFIRKYLEKWLTIRYILTGHASRGTVAPDWLVREIQTRFERNLASFKTDIKGRGRYSIINLNFVIRRILDLVGMRWYAVDFPPLKTESKRKRLVQMWVTVCRCTGWPYINSDQITFPDMKFYNPVSWDHDAGERDVDRDTSKRKRRRVNVDRHAHFERQAARWAAKYK